jgi:hypothetical protein
MICFRRSWPPKKSQKQVEHFSDHKKTGAKMTKTMKWKIVVISVVVLSICMYHFVPKFLVGQHQKSVTLRLKEWQNKYKEIESEKQVINAIEIYEYASKYYTIGEGYFATQKRAMELENQRKKTLDSIVAALEDYTGLQYGHDLEKWKQWEQTVIDGTSKNEH